MKIDAFKDVVHSNVKDALWVCMVNMQTVWAETAFIIPSATKGGAQNCRIVSQKNVEDRILGIVHPSGMWRIYVDDITPKPEESVYEFMTEYKADTLYVGERGAMTSTAFDKSDDVRLNPYFLSNDMAMCANVLNTVHRIYKLSAEKDRVIVDDIQKKRLELLQEREESLVILPGWGTF
ncbi:hypothetical protein [Methylobacillus sp.]|uniref:hypothetical protein n=1 Tax=Methylobacillus sp. TaxID=56818 RepID=UPI0012C75105|nr:hypothetical protein [Methylobacillus sp.]MPS48525.1 hypothetical protein [Methylobacillus sp.]